MDTKNEQNAPGAANVPSQYTGSTMNAMEQLVLSSEAEAVHFFQTVKERLLDVNRWSEILAKACQTFF